MAEAAAVDAAVLDDEPAAEPVLLRSDGHRNRVIEAWKRQRGLVGN